jgi:hypothetical protein
MDTQDKHCSGCKHFKPISSFYKKQPPDLTTNALKTCAECRSRSLRRSSKKRSLQDIDPVTPSPTKILREFAPVSSRAAGNSLLVQSAPSEAPLQSADQSIAQMKCSMCHKPWSSTEYLTCDKCRQRQKDYYQRKKGVLPNTGKRLILLHCLFLGEIMALTTLDSMTTASIGAKDKLLAAPAPLGNSIGSLPSANPPVLPKLKKRKVATDTRASEALKLAVGLLKEEFDLRTRASENFPPEISHSHIRSSIKKYENEMSAASKRSICSSCGSFVTTANIHKIDDQDDFILQQQNSLDQCGHHERSWDFCNFCYTALMHHTTPKFSAANSVNVTMCQHYPSALEDLTVVEECFIAKCHPVGTILKLRPGGHSSPANYNALQGHMIVIPQDPGPLLQILPSSDLKLHNLIKVFWLGKHAPTNINLKPFLQVRKDKVLTALHYLLQHNHLYHNLTINHTMIENWPHDFIPREITENITCLKSPDHHEREGYSVNLETGNYENDLQAAQGEAFSTDEHDLLFTGSVYSDVNGERVNPSLQMIDAVLELVTVPT